MVGHRADHSVPVGGFVPIARQGKSESGARIPPAARATQRFSPAEPVPPLRRGLSVCAEESHEGPARLHCPRTCRDARTGDDATTDSSTGETRITP